MRASGYFMKTFAIALVVLGLALAAAPAGAQEQTAYTLKTAENKYWRTDATGTTNNPTLAVPASTLITVTAVNADSGVHNIRIGGASGETKDLNTPNQEVTYTFTSPASGTVEYICTIHASTMKGVFSVGGAANGNGEDGGDNDSPGFGLVAGILVLAGVALFVARRK